MSEFFHGWRRKTGLVTLAVTLALLVGWGRSFSKFDRWDFPSSSYVFHLIRTAKGNLSWQRLSAAAPSKWSEQWHDEAPAMFAEFASSYGERTFCLILQEEDEVNWNWCFGGIEVGHQDHTTSGGVLHEEVLKLSYWLLLTPLTLISGWLILTSRQPRKRD